MGAMKVPTLHTNTTARDVAYGEGRHGRPGFGGGGALQTLKALSESEWEAIVWEE